MLVRPIGKQKKERKEEMILFQGLCADVVFFLTVPLIEICRALHSRGHEIQFAVLKGWEKLLAPHSFVSKVHSVGRDLTVAEDDELYRLLDASVVSSVAGRRSMAAGIRFSESNRPLLFFFFCIPCRSGPLLKLMIFIWERVLTNVFDCV